MNKIRVRFAPSPTGPLHIGGVRTALYNYLFAKKNKGRFVLRIEDTDRKRYVEGAERYIMDSLSWLGLTPDEGPGIGGDYGPYRQSERKGKYRGYVDQLIESGHAYYAFDTAEELEKMREEQEKLGFHSAKYDHRTRKFMKNSLSLSKEETEKLIDSCPHTVIRLRMPENETVSFTDMVREEVSFNTSELDDKVILKADGMPTYHLANIVDDHLMEITHVIRGEEWLSSTAHHILMYRFLNWTPPAYTHLPLLLKPSGKGKLSKRDGAKFGFPVFPLEWDAGEETYEGFRESGFDPSALINFLVLLGWHPGNDVELMSLEEMVGYFDLGQIVKSGARFDIDKALWFNQQYISDRDDAFIYDLLKDYLPEEIYEAHDKAFFMKLIPMMKPRVQRYTDFYTEAHYLYHVPESYDDKQASKRLSEDVLAELAHIGKLIENLSEFSVEATEKMLKTYLSEKSLKMGVYLPLIRIILCGSMTGPDLFELFDLLGKKEVSKRWALAMEHFSHLI